MEGARLVDRESAATGQEAIGRVASDGAPSRILSLLPEATDILIALGLGDHIVPAPRAGTPPSLTWAQHDCATTETLASAQPTHVFAAATSDGGAVSRRMVRRLVAPLRPRPAVYALEPHTVGDLLSDIKTVGDATGRQAAARALILDLRSRIDRVTLRAAHLHAAGLAPRVACLAGTTPDGDPVAAGWWLAELVGLAGGFDVFAGAGRPPRPVTEEVVRLAEPQIIARVDEIGAGPGVVTLLEDLVDRLQSLTLPHRFSLWG